MFTRVIVLGVGFDAVTQSSALKRVDDFFCGKISESERVRSIWGSSRPKQKFLLFTPNPEMVLKAYKNEIFKKVLNSAELIIPDGIGILWASYFLSLDRRNFLTLLSSLLAVIFAPKKLRRILPARVTGADIFPKICEIAAKRKKKVFLLGADEGVAERLKSRLVKKIPNLQVSGTFSGSPAEGEEDLINQRINESKAELLFVAFGAPAQELWLARNLPKLKTVKFGAGLGGTFNFHAGIISRAPKLFRNLGLEWLWRLIRQPKRLPRIWRATVKFIMLVWRNRKS